MAALNVDGTMIVFAAPTVGRVTASGKTRTEIDRARMCELAASLVGLGYQHVTFEAVGGQKRDGGSKAFRFGQTCERMEGAFWYAGAEITHVSAQRWKGYFRLIGKPKEESVRLAQQYFPGAVEYFTSTRKVRTQAQCEGNAEAALICLWGALHAR